MKNNAKMAWKDGTLTEISAEKSNVCNNQT